MNLFFCFIFSQKKIINFHLITILFTFLFYIPKIYELKKVNWLRGTTVSVYGMAKAGMLVIQSEKKKIVLVSSQTKSVDSFADSELLRIFEKILEHNTELKKDDALDFWYESKSE